MKLKYATENFNKVYHSSNFFVKVIFLLFYYATWIKYTLHRLFFGDHDLVKHVQREVDSLMTSGMQLDKPNISCRKGCSACCHIPVTISGDEADFITEFVSYNNIPVDLSKADLQATSFQYLNISYEDRACIFLNASGECKVYAARPLICRAHQVMSNPEKCKWYGIDFVNDVAHYVLPLVELKVSVVWNTSDVGLLPQMMLTRLKSPRTDLHIEWRNNS